MYSFHLETLQEIMSSGAGCFAGVVQDDLGQAMHLAPLLSRRFLCALQITGQGQQSVECEQSVNRVWSVNRV